MSTLIVEWSDDDQSILETHAKGVRRIHRRFIESATELVAENDRYASVFEHYPIARFRNQLASHVNTLLSDPRLVATQQRSFQVGWAHIKAGIRPSWYLVVYNAYFGAYHAEYDANPEGLPPLEILRRRWLLDVSATLDSYDENVHQELLVMASRMDELRDSAYRDPLTGVANRRALEETIEQYVVEKGETPAMFVLLDLDGFKAINDSKGHIVGDDTLRNIAIGISSHLQGSDILGRLGGDEFCLWYPQRVDVSAVAGEMQHLMQRLSFQNTYEVGCSAGLSQYPKNGQRFRDLYYQADVALYEAKRQGKGRMVAADTMESFPLYQSY